MQTFLREGAKSNNRTQSTREFLATPTFNDRAHKTSANGWSKGSFQHFWCFFIVSFMVSLSLGATLQFYIKKGLYLGLRGGGYNPHSPPPVSAPDYVLPQSPEYSKVCSNSSIIVF